MLTPFAWLLSSALLLQNPAPAPVPPTPHPDERKPAVTIDPELRRAIEALRAANGMRFEATANAHVPPPHALADASAAPLRRPDVDDAVRFTARVERDRPLQIEHEKFDAFRLGDRVAWKPKDSQEWRLFTPKRGDAEETRLLRVVAELPTPRDLIDVVDGRITSCTKVTAREGEEAGTVFECALEADVAKRAFASLFAGETPGLDTLTAAYTLRIVLEHGQVAQLALEHRVPLRGGPVAARDGTAAPRAADDGPVETLQRYRVKEIGNVHVEVPDEVKRLFEDASSAGKTGSASR